MSSSSAARAEGSSRPCTRPGCRRVAQRPCAAEGLRAKRARGAGSSTSAVRPPLLGRGDRRALVLDRDAAEWHSVLAPRKDCARSAHEEREARHQLYDLLCSGGGIVAPLYSTGMPPSG